MDRALELAQQGYPAPNPHVGCVIVRDGEIVGEGYHDHAGGPHAEVVALRQAGDRARGAEVFVTLEPCNHQGRTGPCTQALISAGVAKVWIGALDESRPRAEAGVHVLRDAGVATEVWPEDMAERAQWVARQFSRQRVTVVGKVAITADGFLARLDGTSKWITGESARAMGHSMRAELGAVLVGRRTLELDNPQLTARVLGVVNQPSRLVLDPHSRVGADHEFFASGGRRLCLRAEHGFDIALADTQNASIIQAVAGLGATGLMIEGGATLLSAMLPAMDQFEVFRSPDEWGEGQPFLTPQVQQAFAEEFRVTRSMRLDRDFWFTYKRVGTR